MEKKREIILRVLMNHFHPKEPDVLMKFLSKESARGVMEQKINSSDLSPLFQQPERDLHSIHYSWIQPTLQTIPSSLQTVFASVLTPEQISGLQLPSLAPLSRIAKAFVLNKLSLQLHIGDHFPIDYLPKTEFTPLVLWSKSQLTDLADFLGLYDLASEMRYIVDRNTLKNITSALSQKQLHYLKMCLHQKEQLVSPKLGIDLTKEDCGLKVKQVIHRRGLLRLGKALCGQHPDLIWHIAHILDIGRGNIIIKEFKSTPLPKVTSILKQQVLNLMDFLSDQSKASKS